MRRSRSAGRAAARGRLCCTAVLCAVSAALALPSPAFASGSTFALQVTGSRAPYFVLPARPGQTVSGEVTVINVAGGPGGVLLYPTDATTGQTSGAVYRSPQEPRRDVGAWIQLGARHLILATGQAAVVPFRVLIPSGVRAGQHLGGIVAQPDQPTGRISGRRGRATFHVKVRSIAVIAVELNLPGTRVQQLAITGIRASAEPGYQTLLTGLASTGTALTKGSGLITVRDDQGRRRMRQSFKLDTFVPDTRIDYPVQVVKALPAGSYRATITVAYPGHRLTRVLPFTISNQNLVQAFRSRHSSPPAAGAQSMVPFIVGALALLLVGFAFGRGRTRHPAKR